MAHEGAYAIVYNNKGHDMAITNTESACTRVCVCVLTKERMTSHPHKREHTKASKRKGSKHTVRERVSETPRARRRVRLTRVRGVSNRKMHASIKCTKVALVKYESKSTLSFTPRSGVKRYMRSTAKPGKAFYPEERGK